MLTWALMAIKEDMFAHPYVIKNDIFSKINMEAKLRNKQKKSHD